MEYAWLYPLSLLCFSFFPEMSRPRPAAVMAAMAVTTIVTGILRGRGISRILLVAIEALVLAGDAFIMLRGYYTGPALIPALHSFMQAFELALVLVWSAALWYRSIKIVRDSASALSVGTRFDTGAGMILAIAMLGWGIRQPLAGLENYTAGFFLSGLMALASVNRRGGVEKTHRPLLFAVLASFTGIVFSICIGIWLFARPILGEAARIGLGAFGSGMSAFLPWLVNLLRSVFRMKRTAVNTGTDADKSFSNMVAVAIEGKENSVLRFILIWGFRMAVAGFVILLVASFAPPLLKWLRTPSGRGAAPFRLRFFMSRISAGLRRLIRLLARALGFSNNRGAGMEGPAARAYLRLARWGRRSRLKPSWSETPIEFGRRVAQAFPEITAEATGIAQAFSHEYYGGKIDAEAVGQLNRFCARMASPGLWARRVSRWFTITR